MEFYDVLKNRYSVRKYSDKKVPEDLIDRVLENVKSLPTAKNTNCVRTYAVTDADMLKKLKTASPCTFDAPLVFAVCSDENISWKKSETESRGEMDASIYATGLMLALTNEGLGTCWVCMFDEKTLRDILSIPQNTIPRCLIIAGYAADGCVPNERHFIRPELDESVKKI